MWQPIGPRVADESSSRPSIQQQPAIRSFDTRFLAMTRIGDVITAEAEVTEKFSAHGRRFARITLGASDQHGEAKTAGTAVVELT